jgi:hypothetical protein
VVITRDPAPEKEVLIKMKASIAFRKVATHSSRRQLMDSRGQTIPVTWIRKKTGAQGPHYATEDDVVRAAWNEFGDQWESSLKTLGETKSKTSTL